MGQNIWTGIGVFKGGGRRGSRPQSGRSFLKLHAVFGKLSPKTVRTYLDSFISVHHYLFCSLSSEQTISADVHYHFSSTLPKLDKNSTKTLHNF